MSKIVHIYRVRLKILDCNYIVCIFRAFGIGIRAKLNSQTKNLCKYVASAAFKMLIESSGKQHNPVSQCR